MPGRGSSSGRFSWSPGADELESSFFICRPRWRHDPARAAPFLASARAPPPRPASPALVSTLSRMAASPTLVVLVGLPGAGKTTAAQRLAQAHRALRFTPDEWMIPLFGESDAGGKRDVLEGRLISVALDAVHLGVSVVLDFGCWTRNERLALRWLAEQGGAIFESVHVEVDRATQLARIAERWKRAPESTFPLTHDELERFQAHFEVPQQDELQGFPAGPGQPPAPWDKWRAWAQHRWPSLAVDRRPTQPGSP